MIIESLSLKNYRNYENLKLDFSDGTNIFYGNNAQGKTNILEAVYMSGTTKSHRTNKDLELIRFTEDESHISTIVRKNDISHKIDIHLKNNKSKGVAIDGIPIKKASELFGMINFVFFSPEDLNIIKNGPAEKRRFMDMELCQLNKVYLSEINKLVYLSKTFESFYAEQEFKAIHSDKLKLTNALKRLSIIDSSVEVVDFDVLEKIDLGD